uniref:Glycosyltransferase n=1 Tax=viral metagenome TaxID=1070528 RepID=A0A6C0DT60_9ZZZZ
MAYITAILSGGLGNQLFQIATAYALAQDLGVEFRISKRNFFGAGVQGRGPEHYTAVFNQLSFLDTPLYSDEAVVWEKSWNYCDIRKRVEGMLRDRGYVCIQGYYQSELYFIHRQNLIKRLFTPREGYTAWLHRSRPEIADLYKELLVDHIYCFMGIRRGDYMTPYNRTVHNPCGMTYYHQAMLRMPAERYYIASDDIEWCKQRFVGPQFRFFELGLEDDEAQLALMTLFRRYIISNSTFYWWGSYLSQYEDVAVVAPDKWIFGPTVEFRAYYSIYRTDMTVVERPIEY